MSITDFGNRSKDEIIEYLIDEHNATERETAQLRQELAEARETIEEFKRMICKRSIFIRIIINSTL